MPNLITLPEETIVYILARTPPLGILKCREVCRFMWQIIGSSAELQYLLELYSFGYVPPSNPRQDISYTEKLSLLREHQRGWKTAMPTKVKSYPLQRTKTGSSSTYDFYGGVYARGSPLYVGGRTRCLDLYQLPSVNKGVEWRRWSHSDLGVDVRDFAIEPDYDLLVLIEMNDNVPNGSAPEGTPNATQYFTIHLRSLETNEPHPDARHPTIAYNCPSWTQSRCSFYFQMVGRYLAIVFLIGDPRVHHIGVWDWTTGKMITYTEATQDGSTSFTFISDRLFLIPRPANDGEGLVSRRRGRLDIYTFAEPTGDSPAQPARRIASLLLPELASTVATITKFNCRCVPAPSPSSQSATRHHGHPRIFQLAPDNRVLCLTIETLAINSERGEWDQSQGMLYIPFTDMLGAVAHLLGEPGSDSTVQFAWEDWAKRTSWVDTGSLHTGNECYVFGQRVVSTGVDLAGVGLADIDSDSDSDHERNGSNRVPILLVLDFDPIRLKRESLQTESDIEIFDPMDGGILDFSFGEDVLRATFLEGEHKAAAQFAVRKTVIKEKLTLNHYVMVSDEHVVFALHSRWGGESSLITYSFD